MIVVMVEVVSSRNWSWRWSCLIVLVEAVMAAVHIIITEVVGVVVSDNTCCQW